MKPAAYYYSKAMVIASVWAGFAASTWFLCTTPYGAFSLFGAIAAFLGTVFVVKEWQ